MSRKLKTAISAIAAGMLLTAYTGAFASDTAIYRFAPEYKVDFEDFIYNGEEFPYDTSQGLYNYGHIALSSDTVKEYLELATDGEKGNVLKILPHEAVLTDTNFKTAADLTKVFATDYIDVSFDLYIPQVEDDTLEMLFQAYDGKTGVLFKADKDGIYQSNGTAKVCDLSEVADKWITWEVEYEVAEGGAYLSSWYSVDGVRTQVENATFYNNTFARNIAAFKELRFYCANNKGAILLDNIKITGKSKSSETVFDATADYIIPDSKSNTFSKNYVSGVGGNADTVAKLTAPAYSAGQYTYQTRNAFTLNTFLDDYYEYTQAYYFPENANITLFTQLLSLAKGETAAGNSGVNRFLIPFEIKNGQIMPYSGYSSANFDTSAFNLAEIPVDQWFELKTKVYKEDKAMYFAVDMLTDNGLVSLLPKTPVLWNANDYLDHGLFTFRNTVAQEDTEQDAVLYIGNATLTKAPCIEYSLFAWRDTEDMPVTGNLTDGVVIPEVNITSYKYGQTPVNIFTAAYDADGNLIDVTVSSDSLNEGVPKVITADKAIAVDNAAYVKAFLWNSDMHSLIPFAQITH